MRHTTRTSNDRMNIVAVLSSVALLAATAEAGVVYTINSHAIVGGGGTSSGGAYSLGGTVAQSAPGIVAGGDFTLEGGFWTFGVEPVEACPPDLDDDGEVGASDLGLLLAAWGGRGIADLDGNGVVGASDLGLLLSAWGPCPEESD